MRSFAEAARREGITRRYVERLTRLAFMAPAIVESICQGQQPPDLTAQTLGETPQGGGPSPKRTVFVPPGEEVA